MSETTTNPLAEIRDEHVLCTHSSLRSGGINLHKAGCSCGASYDWYTREAEHDEHRGAMILEHFAAEKAAARREALLEAAEEFRGPLAEIWGGDAAWMTTGTRIGNLVAEILKDSADSLADLERDEEGGR